ncbi:glycosyltransferase, partial [Azospirillum sp. TSH58]
MTVSTIDRPADRPSDRPAASAIPAPIPEADPDTAPVVAVLIPCYNEEAAIAAVVRDFREALPDATVYVYDNNSSDRTVEVAKAAGA